MIDLCYNLKMTDQTGQLANNKMSWGKEIQTGRKVLGNTAAAYRNARRKTLVKLGENTNRFWKVTRKRV